MEIKQLAGLNPPEPRCTPTWGSHLPAEAGTGQKGAARGQQKASPPGPGPGAQRPVPGGAGPGSPRLRPLPRSPLILPHRRLLPART